MAKPSPTPKKGKNLISRPAPAINKPRLLGAGLARYLDDNFPKVFAIGKMADGLL